MTDPLAPLGAAPAGAALFLDFDGVLAEIAPRPELATIRPGLAGVVGALAERLGRVAVVSGRPVDFLVTMLPAHVDLVGLYGLERRIDGAHSTVADAEPWRLPIATAVGDAGEAFGAAVVEPKGVSLTVHYRNDDDLRVPMEQWARDTAARTGLDWRPAKRSFELHPPLHLDKGTAVAELGAGHDPVAYVGDDLGDLPAFDGLDRLADDGATTVRVAVRGDEAPDELLARADHVVDGTAGAEVVLRDLLDRLGG